MDNKFYKNNLDSRVWWLVNNNSDFDEFLFSFDKNKIYDLYKDYGVNMSDEEMRILNEDEPAMARLVSWRIGVEIKESKEYTPDISQEQKRDDIAKGKLSVKEYEDPFKK